MNSYSFSQLYDCIVNCQPRSGRALKLVSTDRIGSMMDKNDGQLRMPKNQLKDT